MNVKTVRVCNEESNFREGDQSLKKTNHQGQKLARQRSEAVWEPAAQDVTDAN